MSEATTKEVRTIAITHGQLLATAIVSFVAGGILMLNGAPKAAQADVSHETPAAAIVTTVPKAQG